MELYHRNRIWWVSFYDADGKRHRVSTKKRVKTAAKIAADQIVARMMTGVATSPTHVPFLWAYMDDFLEHIRSTQLQGHTLRYYANGVRLLKLTKLANRKLDRIANSDCAETHFTGSGSNANCALRTLRRLLSLAAERRIIGAAPRIHLRKEREREAVIHPDLEEEILSFALQPFRDVFLIIMDSGMRPDEVIRMRWDDLLWDRSLIFVPEGKTAKARRHVPLSDRVRNSLKARAVGSTSPWVFPSVRRNKTGERGHIRAFGISKEWTRLRQLLNIPPELVLYSARHTFGTDLMDRVKGNIVLVSDVLGHSDMKITRRYIHPSTLGVADLVNERNAAKKFGHNFRHKGEIAQ